jgi:hypothetical protein
VGELTNQFTIDVSPTILDVVATHMAAIPIELQGDGDV